MALANTLLQAIKEKFPGHAACIERLFSTNEDFRALCFDYVLCLKYLQKFKKEFDDKRLSLNEYNNVRTELENELSHFILDS